MPVDRREFEALLGADAGTRYEYFVKRCADFQEIWGLAFNDGGWAFSGGGETLAFPVWPFSEYAEEMACDEWKGCAPKAIPLDAFLERWLPGLERDNRSVLVFPTPRELKPVVPPNVLLDDLRNELTKYEG
jgi:hypothetical protein